MKALSIPSPFFPACHPPVWRAAHAQAFPTELSIYAFVGVIMLVGLVKKNAIMMIDFALDAQREEGKSATKPSTRARFSASARS